jgi:hypothetical protein
MRVTAFPTENALREHLRAHNASVLSGSGIAVLLAAIGWAVFYGLSYFITLFVLTVARWGDSQVSARFNDIFLMAAGALLLTARVHQWFFPHERAVDRRPPLGHALDILLFVPRFTLSAWQNLSALVYLKDDEMRLASTLLDHLRETGRMPAQHLPQFLDHHISARIVDTLKVARIVDQLTSGDLTWLYISSLAPEAFRGIAPGREAPGNTVGYIRREKTAGQHDPQP